MFGYKYKTDNEFYREAYGRRDSTSCINTRYAPAIDLDNHEYLLENADKCCPVCGKHRNYWQFIKIGSILVCKGCKDKIKFCDICGKVWKYDTGKENEQGARFCEECATQYGHYCRVCDEFILPEGTSEEIKDNIIENGKNSKTNRKATLYKSSPSSDNLVKGSVCDACREAARNAKEDQMLSKLLPTLHTYSVNSPRISVVDKINVLDTIYVGNMFNSIYRVGECLSRPSTSRERFRYNKDNLCISIYHTYLETSEVFRRFYDKNIIGVVAVNRGEATKYIKMRSIFKSRGCRIPKVLLAKPWEDINLVDNNIIMSANNTNDKLEVVVATPTEARQREIVSEIYRR